MVSVKRRWLVTVHGEDMVPYVRRFWREHRARAYADRVRRWDLELSAVVTAR